MKLGALLSGTLFVFTALPAWSAADEPDKVIASLRQVTIDLNDAVKRFQTDLDREIALHDRGYRAANGRRIQGADSDFVGASADIAQITMRKLFAARMIASRRRGYAPPPLTDYDHIVELIMEARSRMNTGNDVMRTLLVVAAKDMTPAADMAQKLRFNELQKARTAAAEAAKKRSSLSRSLFRKAIQRRNREKRPGT